MERELTQICAYLTPRVKETVAYYRGEGVRIEEIRLRREGMLCFTAEGKTVPTRVMLSAKEFETNFASLVQYAKTTGERSVTLAGISIDVSERQCSNAF